MVERSDTTGFEGVAGSFDPNGVADNSRQVYDPFRVEGKFKARFDPRVRAARLGANGWHPSGMAERRTAANHPGAAMKNGWLVGLNEGEIQNDPDGVGVISRWLSRSDTTGFEGVAGSFDPNGVADNSRQACDPFGVGGKYKARFNPRVREARLGVNGWHPFRMAECGTAANHPRAVMKNGWQHKKLGDVCIFEKLQGVHKRLPYVGLEHIESNTGKFIGSHEACAVKSSTFRFSPAHLLFGRLRPYLNKVMLPNFDGHCSTEIFPIKPNSGLLREFLHYWFMREETVSRINATSTARGCHGRT